MTVIKTDTNRVVADEPEDDHTHVQVVWFSPSQDGRHRKVFDGPLMPIEDYQEAVAWAVSMANQMTYPLYVVPLCGTDALADERLQRAAATLSEQERNELRRFVVAQLAAIMRDCDDAMVRADAYDVLVGLRVVQP
ncbi:hypothetical protein [Blastomonas fulva]|uniref:hypothetical protein n=1 Tax=Blastomonas fulva TaxID=1550728 RepID=UPI0025A45F22|nr:hypothetical protein [Blastomonas fulva]MDM7930026.1 hypothetical protein [Blastomonas fulva]MDM7966209.1 hypothetical protein [Blastomonas fulva]